MSSAIREHHPVGLYLLCIIELCERFAASLFGSLLLLYLNERLGLPPGSAARLGGVFNAAVYLSSVLGGAMADRWLGTQRAMLLGAALLAAGYAALSLDRAAAMHPSTVLLILGHALFKPNINAAVGKLYERGSPRREQGFSLFYVVFNVGSACGPAAGGALRAAYGWSLAFSVAALAMLLALAAGLVSYRSLTVTGNRAGELTAARPNERSPWPVGAIVALLSAGLLFTAVYEQTGQSLLLWARDCTERRMARHSLPPSSLLALPGLLVLALQPLLNRMVSLWTRHGDGPSALNRIQLGLMFGIVGSAIMIGAALLHGQQHAAVSSWWLVACFVALTLGELLVYPLSMALVTRLAPTSSTAAAMGLWMAAIAIGQWLAGEVAARWAVWSHVELFSALSAIALTAVVVLAVGSRFIERSLAMAAHETQLH